MELGERPLGRVAVGPARFRGDGFGAFAVLLASACTPLRAVTDAGEFFQTDQSMWVRLDNGFRDAVVGLQFQPSLSPAHGDFAPRGGTSAFLLQAFLEPGIMVSFYPDSFS